MELRQLAHFVAVAEDGSFTRAASRLGYVQSALSVSIQGLERELGLRLFDRTTHRVRLTEEGRMLVASARATLAAADEFHDAAAAVKGVIRGTLRLGLMQAFTQFDVPRLLGAFHRLHPDVEIVVRPATGGSVSLLQDVAAGELDIAVVADDGAARGLHTIALMREELALTSAPDVGPEPGDAPVRVQDLQDETFVDFPRGWGVRTVADRAFAEAGVTRHVGIEVADVGTLVRLLREGLGVALFPRSLLPDDDQTLVRRPVTPSVFWQVVIALPGNRRPSAAAAAFMELVDASRAESSG